MQCFHTMSYPWPHYAWTGWEGLRIRRSSFQPDIPSSFLSRYGAFTSCWFHHLLLLRTVDERYAHIHRHQSAQIKVGKPLRKTLNHSFWHWPGSGIRYCHCLRRDHPCYRRSGLLASGSLFQCSSNLFSHQRKFLRLSIVLRTHDVASSLRLCAA